MNRAAHRADAKLGPAEIQVVGAIEPVRGTDAENILSVPGLHVAHRTVAAVAGLEAGEVVATLGRVLDYFRRNPEPHVASPFVFPPATLRFVRGAHIDKYQYRSNS